MISPVEAALAELDQIQKNEAYPYPIISPVLKAYAGLDPESPAIANVDPDGTVYVQGTDHLPWSETPYRQTSAEVIITAIQAEIAKEQQ